MNMWDERFGRADWVYGKEPNDFLREQASRIPLRAGQSRVLSLGEGEGRNAVFLAQLGHRVTAVDASLEGLKKIKRLAAERGVSVDTVHADLAAWEPEEAAFDGVISVFCHLPEPVRRHAHRSAARALAQSGVLILEAYSPAQLAFGTGGPKDVALLYTVDMLSDDFGSLDLEIAREVEREVVEGSLHTGRAATVQILAHCR
jgi:SAM-dependent methyltransferase